MILEDIATIIQENIPTAKLYIGKLYDTTKQHADNTGVIVLYPMESAPRVAIGRIEGYHNKRVKILVHWNKKYVESYNTAKSVYELFDNVRTDGFVTAPRQSEPLYMGTDDYDIFEWVIELDVMEYTERS